MRLITIKQIELRMSFLMKFKSLSCAVAVMSALSQGANAFDVKVEGIDGDVLFNVEVMLQPVRENSITDVRQTYRAQVDRAIQRGVQALGYYQSTIQYKWEEAKNEDGEVVDYLPFKICYRDVDKHGKDKYIFNEEKNEYQPSYFYSPVIYAYGKELRILLELGIHAPIKVVYTST